MVTQLLSPIANGRNTQTDFASLHQLERAISSVLRFHRQKEKDHIHDLGNGPKIHSHDTKD